MASSTTFTDADLKDVLRKKFVGKTLLDVPTPSAVLDISKVKRNCERMLEAVDKLDFGWRVHIKTHKTEELTRLQVGDGIPANIIVSTIIEAERIVPLLLKLKNAGRAVNVSSVSLDSKELLLIVQSDMLQILYSFPVPPSSIARLAAISKVIGPSGLSLLIDHPTQLSSVYAIAELSGSPPLIYIKIDMGGKRAGVLPQSPASSQLISDLLSASNVSPPRTIFHGFYSHAGQSYGSSSRAASIDYLRQELEALYVTAASVASAIPGKSLVLSVGATPTATAIRNLLIQDFGDNDVENMAISALKGTIETIRNEKHLIEIHAGVYPLLDIQQLATHALSTEGPDPMLGWSDLAFTVLAEVASLYPGRGTAGGPEALVGAGSLALGREPCKAYGGWGIVSPWNKGVALNSDIGPESHEGWIVGRISQEHGILCWNGDAEKAVPFVVGEKVRIWPNHACITGACFDWYLIIDSERQGKEDEVVDVWPRWRGW